MRQSEPELCRTRILGDGVAEDIDQRRIRVRRWQTPSVCAAPEIA